MNYRKLTRFATRLVAAGSFAAAALFTPHARALPEFPQVISEELATPCIPQCTLCHKTTQGGAGTTDENKPFFISMLNADASFVTGNPDGVRSALGILATNLTDSDGDGMPDTEELSQGRDPNQDGEGQLCGGIRYGCGAHIAPSRSTDFGAVSAALAAVLALLATRRRARS
jgi:hypothetical protein